MPPPAEAFASRLFLGPALRAQSDHRLVTLVRAGYEAAFEEIVRRYGKPLTRYAAAIVGSRSEDVAQDAFSKALVALRRDGAEIELRPWLYRIVRNTALNDLRDRPPTPEALAEEIAGGGDPALELERREELTDLIRRLGALPEPQRAAIVMRELEGLSHEEIAAALGMSGGAARQAIYRARQALRDGAGMLVPLPLLKALLEGAGAGTAEAAVGAAGIGGAAGAGVALKATAATVLVAGAVGAGVALDHGSRSHSEMTPARSAPSQVADSAAPAETDSSAGSGGQGGSGPGDDSQRGHEGGGHGEGEPGDDHGGRGEEEPGDDHGGRGEAEPGDDHGGGNSGSGSAHSGPSGHDGNRHGSGHGGDDHGGHSGHGGNTSGGHNGGSGSGHGDHSGPSSSSHGHGGGSSGTGHGGPGPSTDLETGGGSGGSGRSGGSGPVPGREPTEGDPSSGDDSSASGGSGSSSGSGPGPSGESSGDGQIAP